jgi:hypothetical protein
MARLTETIVMLPEVRANERNKLQLHLHMPGSKSADEGGSSNRVRELWMQRVCF